MVRLADIDLDFFDQDIGIRTHLADNDHIFDHCTYMFCGKNKTKQKEQKRVKLKMKQVKINYGNSWPQTHTRKKFNDIR